MKKIGMLLLLALVALMTMNMDECDAPAPQSASGVHKADAKVVTGADGLTVEQRNIKGRLEEDNKPGSIKHLYIISPYSGQVILYSTVKGKVTSGGKRLTPDTISDIYRVSKDNVPSSGFGIQIGDTTAITKEVLQDDGTYGHSGDYLYWWDVRGVYHQHYLTGGQIVTISSQPLPVKSVTINLEAVNEK